jgi:hypothetical protein
MRWIGEVCADDELSVRNIELLKVRPDTTTVDCFVSCNLTNHISRRSESFE